MNPHEHRPGTVPHTDAPAKATLICPSCGHRSPPTGDWTVRETGDGTARPRSVYGCPECGATVTIRPQYRCAARP